MNSEVEEISVIAPCGPVCEGQGYRRTKRGGSVRVLEAKNRPPWREARARAGALSAVHISPKSSGLDFPSLRNMVRRRG